MILVKMDLKCNKCGHENGRKYFTKADSYNVGGVPSKCPLCDGNMIIEKICKTLVRKNYDS